MKYVFAILLLVGFSIAATSVGSPHFLGTGSAIADEHDDAREALKRGDIMPYSEIKRIIEEKVEGKVVGQKLRRTNRGWQYDLRVRPQNGRVMVLVVNAKNGEIVSRR